MEYIKNFQKNKKAVALLTVNLDGEQFWKGMFPDSVRRPKTLSMGDYGITRGLDRILQVYKEYEIESTFFVPGMIMENHEEAIYKILKHGHEVALHGHTHRPMHTLSLEEQEEECGNSIAAYQKVVGGMPLGFRPPEGEIFKETLEIHSRMGLQYSSSLYDSDKPYFHEDMPNPLMELPMNWNTHDFSYFAFNYGPAFPIGQSRVAPYQNVESNFIQEFDAYLQYGLLYMAQFTPQSIGSPGKIQILENIVKHICNYRDDVLICKCKDLL